ncbi:hypothetical protein BH18ACT1_BH18ACT1_05780 [soil metagenome]
MTRLPDDLHEWIGFEDPDENRSWVFDLTFLLSRWTCIFGLCCQGVLTEPAPELVRGCCSYGAHFTDDEDRARVEAAVAELSEDQWQFARIGRRKGISVAERSGSWRTRVHDGACILLNRPGFATGPGCALHTAALQRGQQPLETKPEVCWQLPLRRLDSTDENGHVTSTVREWKRRDWGAGGEEFHWWCTESPDAFVVDEGTVLVRMRDELIAMVGAEVHRLLVSAVAERLAASTTPLPHPAVRPKRRPRP